MTTPARTGATRPVRIGRRTERAGRARLGAGWFAAGVAAVVVTSVAGVAIGTVGINPFGAAAELLNLIPGVDSTVTVGPEAAIIPSCAALVVPRLLVGAMLARAGGCYQGVFRNPLADPYLLGVAAGPASARLRRS
jgi:iron complex transport system permease protein